MKIFEKVSYDKDADACYIVIKKSKIVQSEPVKSWLILDKDEKGKLVGIEVLSAKKHMSMVEKILLSQESLKKCVLS